MKPLTLLIRPLKTFLRPAGGTKFRLRGLISLPIYSGGELVDVLHGVAFILATKIVAGTSFIDVSIKSFFSERPRRDPRIGRRPEPIHASFTDSTTAHLGLDDAEKHEKQLICEAAKMIRVPLNFETVLEIAKKSAETFIEDGKGNLTIRTRVLPARAL